METPEHTCCPAIGCAVATGYTGRSVCENESGEWGMEVGDAHRRTKGRAALRAFLLRPRVCSGPALSRARRARMQGAGKALLPRPREAGVVEGTWEGSAAASGLSVLGYTREREQEREPLLG